MRRNKNARTKTARYSTKRSKRASSSTSVRRESVNQERLAEIVRRVVQVAQPEKVILFGSAARGTMRPNSDIDLLVVKANAHRRQLAKQIYRHLIGVNQAVDIVVVTPDDIERYRDSHALIIAPALRDGKVVYAA